MADALTDPPACSNACSNCVSRNPVKHADNPVMEPTGFALMRTPLPSNRAINCALARMPVTNACALVSPIPGTAAMSANRA